MPRKLDILVTDDLEVNRNLICKFVSKLGHTPIAAADGLQAVDYCRRQLPDLVLMDIMMPVMDGYAATASIRRLCGERWLPIIFLSAKGSEADQLEGLDSGGADDYLPKPVNLAMLAAKIGVMARIADMQQRIAENATRLETYRQNNEQEQILTRHILDHIIGYKADAAGPVRRWIKPAHNLSGDVIVYGRSPSGAINLLLADSTGHGLASAIGAVPAIDAFTAMTRRGFAIGAIAREVNAKLHRLLPADHFVSAAFVSVECLHKKVSVWNGGIPSLLFVDKAGKIRHQWKSLQPPLGVLSDADFDAYVETSYLETAGEIILCSDGLTEAENEDGEQFGSERLGATLAAIRGCPPFDAVIDAVIRHLGSREPLDDISLAAIAYSPGAYLPGGDVREPAIERRPYQASGWSLSLRFSAAELKSQDCQPLLVSWLNQLNLNAVQFRELLLVITELFNNALDHGVLRLDSALKQRPEGFEAYLRQRTERLECLDQGYIEVSLERVTPDGEPALRLRMRNSGAGFDHQRVLDCIGREGEALPYGRGLALVRKLCSKVDYDHGGSEVLAEYSLMEET